MLRGEVMVLRQEAFDIPGSNDVINLFGADNGWDVLEEITKRYMQEIPLSSQQSRMAVADGALLTALAAVGYLAALAAASSRSA